jgi:hypothetical protein
LDDGLGWILFDRLGFGLNGRVCDVFSFMRYRYACEVIAFNEAKGPRMRDGILFVNALGNRGRDEPESLILAQSERWRHA